MCIQNNGIEYKYNQVTYTLSATNLNEYRSIAEQINEKDIGLVCIQHEFGLFVVVNMAIILAFILALNKPIATIFHTVLPNPDQKKKKNSQCHH
jgi:hypothetical protein